MSILRAFSSLDEATNERVSYHQTGQSFQLFDRSHLALREYGLVNTALRVGIVVWMWFVTKPKPNEEIADARWYNSTEWAYLGVSTPASLISKGKERGGVEGYQNKETRSKHC
eukprot:scaffold2584_cov164-Alexandrium_tamarense.AAC.12